MTRLSPRRETEIRARHVETLNGFSSNPGAYVDSAKAIPELLAELEAVRLETLPSGFWGRAAAKFSKERDALQVECDRLARGHDEYNRVNRLLMVQLEQLETALRELREAAFAVWKKDPLGTDAWNILGAAIPKTDIALARHERATGQYTA